MPNVLGRQTRPFPHMLARLAAPLVVAASSLFALAATADMIGHGGLIRGIDVAPNGDLALTASFDYSARLWHFDEQSEARALRAHEGPVNDAKFTPDGQHVVTAGADGKLIVWPLADPHAPRIIAAHDSRLVSLAVSHTGDSVVSAAWNGTVGVWALPDGKRTAQFALPVELVAVALGPKDRLIYAAGRDGRVRVLRMSDGIQVAAFPAHNIGLTQLAVSANGSRLATVGHDGRVKFWETGTFKRRSAYGPQAHVMPVAVALNTTGETAAVGYLDGSTRVIDTGSTSVLRTLRVENGPVWAVAFSPDDRFLLAAGADERVRVWHLPTGDRINTQAEGEHARPTPWLTDSHPGARHFRKCAVCHALTASEPQRAGPHFVGLFGRRAGAVADYAYSEALIDAEIVWNRATVAELFRTGPDKYLPGTKMPVQRIRGERQLTELVDYLEHLLRP